MIRTGIPQVKKGGRDVRAAVGSPSCGNAGFHPAACALASAWPAVSRKQIRPFADVPVDSPEDSHEGNGENAPAAWGPPG